MRALSFVEPTRCSCRGRRESRLDDPKSEDYLFRSRIHETRTSARDSTQRGSGIRSRLMNVRGEVTMVSLAAGKTPEDLLAEG